MTDSVFRPFSVAVFNDSRVILQTKRGKLRDRHSLPAELLRRNDSRDSLGRPNSTEFRPP